MAHVGAGQCRQCHESKCGAGQCRQCHDSKCGAVDGVDAGNVSTVVMVQTGIFGRQWGAAGDDGILLGRIE